MVGIPPPEIPILGAIVSVVVLSPVLLSSSELLVVEDELSLDEEPPSSLPQEIMVRLNRNRERMISICLIFFLIG